MKQIFSLKELAEMRKEAINAGLDAIQKNARDGAGYTLDQLSEMTGGILSPRGLEISANRHTGLYSGGLYSTRNWSPRTRVRLERGKSQCETHTFTETDENGQVVRKWTETKYTSRYCVK